jgi:hypothetical protein
VVASVCPPPTISFTQNSSRFYLYICSHAAITERYIVTIFCVLKAGLKVMDEIKEKKNMPLRHLLEV